MKRRGFSLTEVVVGIFLLTIVWLSAAGVTVMSNISGAISAHKVQASYVIQQKIEDLRRQTFSSIASSAGEDPT